jgi:hypothetical protein
MPFFDTVSVPFDEGFAKLLGSSTASEPAPEDDWRMGVARGFFGVSTHVGRLVHFARVIS